MTRVNKRSLLKHLYVLSLNWGKVSLNLITVWANSADDKFIIFFLFFSANSFDISCILSPKETICIKCQNLFSEKKKKKKNKKKIFQNLSEIFTQNAKHYQVLMYSNYLLVLAGSGCTFIVSTLKNSFSLPVLGLVQDKIVFCSLI